MKVIVAESAGFCFGVERAVRMCEDAGKTNPECYMYGEITHNKTVLDDFAQKGVKLARSVGEIPEGAAVVIRAHGVSQAEYSAMTRRKLDIVDATCPFVTKIHDIVKQAEADGYLPVVIGKHEHAEVRGIAGQVADCVVCADETALRAWIEQTNGADKNIAVVFQTTLNREIFDKAYDFLKKVCTNAKIFDTICATTQERYAEAEKLAKSCDVMIVIGDAMSANSRGLYEIAKKHCGRTYFIENAGELPDFSGEREITFGVTAGASTPACIIKEVNQKMFEEAEVQIDETAVEPVSETPVEAAAVAEPAEIVTDEPVTEPVAEAEVAVEAEAVAEEPEVVAEEAEAAAEEPEAPARQETFEEMLEKSIKTLHTGDKVTGIVVAITPTDVSVDLGIKQSAYIPLAELTDDPSKNPEDVVKIGDEVEAFVMRVNDVEGTVQLSRRRLDAIKNWADIEQAMKDRTVVEGLVTEENKGGVVVMIRGVRVFVPASRTGLPRETPMTELVRKTVRLLITEVNQPRRRVVGSISAVANEERKLRAEKIWSEIEVGKKYSGVVKSMTSYGAFIDVGGVDGMVHKSELSWSRIRQPSDVLKVGDEVEVFVISYDPEKRKISLGCKDRSANPWTQFTTKYNVGDVAPVRIVKLMKYGAFAEILPGVDGLIHVSQVTDHRIGEPGDVLKEGQTVDVKITEIDNERQKVSLSIRALMNEPRRSTPGDDMPEIVYDTEIPDAYDDDDEDDED